MGKHLSKYQSEADYNNNKDNHVKPHISLITSSPKKMKYEKKSLLKLITFYIDNTEYQAEEGMTWEDWINSDYNTDGYNKGGLLGDLPIFNLDGDRCVLEKPKEGINVYYVFSQDLIISSYNYVLDIKLITFTINEFEYQAETGMTWEEWVNSDYNTNIQSKDYYGKDYKIKNNNVIYIMAGGPVCLEGSRLKPGSPVLKTDVIINQYSYEHGLSTDPE